jgi:putative endonuclease
MFFVYIIYSASRDRYYVGYTGDDLDNRMEKHNTNHAGYTGGLGDWKLKYQESFPDKQQAIRREKEIKLRKSRKYIEELIEKAG